MKKRNDDKKYPFKKKISIHLRGHSTHIYYITALCPHNTARGYMKNKMIYKRIPGQGT